MGSALALIVATGFWLGLPRDAQALSNASLQWIWFDEGDPAVSAPVATRFFRRAFTLPGPAEEGTLDITADDAFTVWLNGVQVGKGNTHKHVYRFDVRPQLQAGRNVLAVQAENKSGPAGLLVRFVYGLNGQAKEAILSDASWLAARTAAAGWEKIEFKEKGWSKAKVLGPYGKAGPWRNLTWDAGGTERFAVPPDFHVEMAVKIPANDPKFSLINMCFDDKGRLLVSRENGAVLVCTGPNADGVLQDVRPYCTQVRNCQGMCWVKDALLLVGNGPKGTGLYRVRDTKGQDKIDEVTLLHRFRAGMGEHGPHAILHGPDDWLYVVIGNHSGAVVDKLAANSPLRRWPTGAMGPDQGKPNTTEDVLLPRLNDANGHAANVLAPGGTIWRMDHEGKNMSLVAAGFRNHFDAAFSPLGELFTFDSDMEWDENLPWYRAVRVCHCPPGADFVWRTGAANTPDYYIDSLPPMCETGRGSPVGLEFYDHNVFPEKYRGAYFMGDWSLGIIYAVHLERAGATYKAQVERFCTGVPMNVTDLNVGPDGAIYFVMGGRNSQGGVYRIVYDKAQQKQPAANIVTQLLNQPQPLAPWSRKWFAEVRKKDELPGAKGAVGRAVAEAAQDDKRPARERIRALDLLENLWPPDVKVLLPLAHDKHAGVREHAIALLGLTWQHKLVSDTLVGALKDEDAGVRRHVCEALIRAGDEPPMDALWPLLGDPDRFVRHAARLVLERIAPKQWADRVWAETNDLRAWNGIIALCQTNQAAPYAEKIFGRLHGNVPAMGQDVTALLDYLRTVQMALIHVDQRPIWVKAIAQQCDELFPHADWRVNRELAILLTQFRREAQLDAHVNAKLLDALLAAKEDRLQQIHYFYCLRLIDAGWTTAQRTALAAWYNGT